MFSLKIKRIQNIVIVIAILAFCGALCAADDWCPMENLSQAPNSLYENCRIRSVPQSGIAYFKASDPVHCFASTSGGPCVILAARHRPSGAGFLAHVAAFSEIDPWTWSGSRVLRRLKTLAASDETSLSHEADVIDFCVLGGCCCTSCPLKVSVERFIDRVNSDIKTVGTVNYMDACRSWSPRVLIDLKTGNYYQYSPAKDNHYKSPSPLNIFTDIAMTMGSIFIFGLCEI